jgi:hypothetical protein
MLEKQEHEFAELEKHIADCVLAAQGDLMGDYYLGLELLSCQEEISWSGLVDEAERSAIARFVGNFDESTALECSAHEDNFSRVLVFHSIQLTVFQRTTIDLTTLEVHIRTSSGQQHQIPVLTWEPVIVGCNATIVLHPSDAEACRLVVPEEGIGLAVAVVSKEILCSGSTTISSSSINAPQSSVHSVLLTPTDRAGGKAVFIVEIV